MEEQKSMLTRLTDWLSHHKGINIIIIIIYYLLVVLPHEQVGLFTVKFFNKQLKLSRDNYNLLIASIAILGLLLYAGIFIKNVRKSEAKRKISLYMVATVFLAVLIMKTLFVINIEVVHYVQYAVFSILFFPLVRNYWHTLVWATLAGSLDEAYQYFYLAPHRTDYYDFNDVLTNLIGAAFGLVFLRAYDIKGGIAGWQSFLKSSTFIALLISVLVVAGFYFSGILQIYPNEDSDAMYTVVRVVPSWFWTFAPPNVIYHIALPLEGIILTVLLWLFYIPLGDSTK